MSNQQKIWDFILRNQNTTVSNISQKTEIKKEIIVQYLWALKSAGYIETHTQEGKRGAPIETVKLVNNSGVIAPRYNRGLVIDANTKKEWVVSQKNAGAESRAKLLIPILEAIVALNKEEIIVAEISHTLSEKLDGEQKYPSAALNGWLSRLEAKELIADTNVRQRNSRIYLVDRAGIEKLLEEVRSSKAYWLHI